MRLKGKLTGEVSFSFTIIKATSRIKINHSLLALGFSGLTVGTRRYVEDREIQVMLSKISNYSYNLVCRISSTFLVFPKRKTVIRHQYKCPGYLVRHLIFVTTLPCTALNTEISPQKEWARRCNSIRANTAGIREGGNSESCLSNIEARVTLGVSAQIQEILRLEKMGNKHFTSL